MRGPCMCGDPYCGSCGNPSQAAYADWLETVTEMIDVINPNEAEAHVIHSALEKVLNKVVKAREEIEP